jgi:cell division septation protein DedD
MEFANFSDRDAPPKLIFGKACRRFVASVGRIRTGAGGGIHTALTVIYETDRDADIAPKTGARGSEMGVAGGMKGVLGWTAGLLVLAAPAAAGVKEGVEKWQSGDHKGAVVEWLPFAAKGDPDALFNLGQAYKLGRGVPMDKAKAEDFYRRAADKGHAPAQSNLGILLAQRGDKAGAAQLWLKAAEKREPRAQYMLGVLHFNGDTVEKNWPLAYAYMLQANAAGLPQAARALATMTTNMTPADRDKGAQLASSMGSGDRLANSGKPLPQPRRMPNDIAATKPAEPVALPKAAAAKPVETPINFAPAPAGTPGRSVVASADVPVPAGTTTRLEGSATPRWRVQMGAFSREARARDAWTALRRDHGALVAGVEPHYVNGGDVVRLQLGAFVDAASAGALCQKLKAAGNACFIVEVN